MKLIYLDIISVIVATANVFTENILGIVSLLAKSVHVDYWNP